MQGHMRRTRRKTETPSDGCGNSDPDLRGNKEKKDTPTMQCRKKNAKRGLYTHTWPMRDEIDRMRGQRPRFRQEEVETMSGDSASEDADERALDSYMPYERDMLLNQKAKSEHMLQLWRKWKQDE
jgi:hypothetical protein